MNLGKRQIDLLRALANPHLFMVVGDAVCVSLAKRGLLKAVRKPKPRGDGKPDHGAFYQITPAGMRVVADLWQSRVVSFPPPKRRKRKAGAA
jgi:hypothetical protein